MLEIPVIKPYMISAENQRLLQVVDKRSNRGDITNLLIQGDQGTGKSEFVNQFGATRKRPVATFEIGRLSESSQIFGYTELVSDEKGQRTVYVPGMFTEAVQTPFTVIHLQEINRPESDKALNAVFSMLDDTFRKIWLDELQMDIKVAEGVTIFASLNQGYQFIGTVPLDEALRSRFKFKIQLGALPVESLQQLLIMRVGLNIPQITALLELTRKLSTNTQNPIPVSTRDIFNIAELMKDDLPLLNAVKAVVGRADELVESMLLEEHFAGRDSDFDAGEKFEIMRMASWQN